MSDLIVTLFQANLVWEDKQANINRFEEKIQNLAGRHDLIILPEMFSTGFSMNAAPLAETMDDATVRWMIATARRQGAHITGSIIIKENNRFYNRLVWAQPDGGLFTYDKRHLFRYADEHHTYHPGENLLTVSLNGWRIRPFICYDLRFPVWTRNSGPTDNYDRDSGPDSKPKSITISNLGYDLAIFIANWPKPRADHWRTLLKARAIENQAIVIGVNRVGVDGNGLEYNGDSTVIDPTGQILFHATSQEIDHTSRLSYQDLEAYRRSFPALMDADRFQFEC